MMSSAFGKYRKPEEAKSVGFRRWLEKIILLLLGFSLGLAVTWEIFPIGQVDPSPAALRTDFQDDYRFLVASAFSKSGDIGRARVRLSLLDDPDPVQALMDQTKREITLGSSQHRILALSALSDAIQLPAIPSPSPTGILTSTVPPPTATPSFFVLISQEIICDPESAPGFTRIQIQDNMGLPLAGVEVRVTSENGQQHVFSGLKPELGDGYADFILSPGITYSLKVIPSNQVIDGIQIPECRSERGQMYGGGYTLFFGHP
jgi:hypothetical protein